MQNFGQLISDQNTKGPPFASSKDYYNEMNLNISKSSRKALVFITIHPEKCHFFIKNIPIFMVKNYAEFQLTPAEMAGSLGWQDSKLSTTTPHPPLQSKTEALFVAVS